MSSNTTIARADSPRLLLVFGSARSGTSWIGKIFDSHPLTLYKHEPDRTFPGVPMAPRLEDADKYAGPIRQFIERLPDCNESHVAGSLPIFAKKYRSELAAQVHRASVFSTMAGSVLHFNLPVLQCGHYRRSNVCLVWKSIDSLGRLGPILQCAENARAVLITRHPCACISSTLRGEAQGHFSASTAASEDFGIMRILLASTTRKRQLTLEHLQAVHPVERMAWIWVLTNEKAFDDAQHSDRYMSVRYEDFCANPVVKTQELFSFCGLAWNEQTARFIKASTLGERPGWFEQLTQNSGRYYGLFRDPLSSANKWKTKMTPDNVERVYSVLRQSDLISLYPQTTIETPTELQSA